jgi:hypothetical protein
MSIDAPQTVRVSDWQHGAHLGINGISYDIFINEHADQFSAAWVCQTCCEQSTWRAKVPTWEAAIERAKVGAQIHHSFMHLRN